MWIVGVWPDPRISSINSKPQSNLKFIIVTCILSLYVSMPQVMNMIGAWGNVVLMVEHVASANFCLLALCKLIVTRYNGETLRATMTLIMDDWMTAKSDWKRDVMLKIAKRGRSLTLRCYMSTTGTCVFYLLFNLLRFYHTWPLQSKRRLIYPFAYPYNFLKSPNYEITFFIQFSGGILTAFINFSIDCFVSQLLLHICAQLINVRIMFSNLINELANKSISSSEYKKGLSIIAIRHKDLIRITKTINDCYSAVLFVNMLAATFQLCFQTFQVYTKITNKDAEVPIIRIVFLIFYVMTMLTHLYIYCYSAERLITESIGVAYGVYESKWYDIPPKDARNLMFIIHRSTIPLRLTAGKFATFSMEMFGIVVKTSIGYVSVLLTIKD